MAFQCLRHDTPPTDRPNWSQSRARSAQYPRMQCAEGSLSSLSGQQLMRMLHSCPFTHSTSTSGILQPRERSSRLRNPAQKKMLDVMTTDPHYLLAKYQSKSRRLTAPQHCRQSFSSTCPTHPNAEHATKHVDLPVLRTVRGYHCQLRYPSPSCLQSQCGCPGWPCSRNRCGWSPVRQTMRLSNSATTD